ncbi:polysaccharide deacetylase family protein [Natranaerobius trueperi]|uniref:NodB homology domain-containing protein n=1 Tax=Natranaerobius trueperi TaxID=759412 RepID=A0A226C169_9FIRM|nr:polysaccharide deacetylase family protein [Natranaerobius trueperi]OWZ84966.1 hypothetical protein CDO51_00750 [Natranaerobius trueperi]
MRWWLLSGLLIALLVIGSGLILTDDNSTEQVEDKNHDIKIPVLMYHHFSDDPQTSATITPDDFEEQLKFLKEHNFESIDVDDVITFVETGDDDHLPKRPVLITIDDGYRSTYTKAFPLLEEYNFDATLFMITERINQLSDEGYDFLTDDELLELEEAGIKVESHSVSHVPFTERKEDEQDHEWRNRIQNELEESKEVLEQLLERKVNYFAYPFGAWDTQIENWVVDAEYEGTFLVREGYVTEESHPQRLFRFGVTKDMTLDEFKSIFEPLLDEEEMN